MVAGLGPPDAGLRHRCLGRVVPARAGGAARPGPGSGVWLGRRLPMPEQSATSNYIGNTRQRYRCLHSSLALALPGPQWMAPIPQECGWSGRLPSVCAEVRHAPGAAGTQPAIPHQDSGWPSVERSRTADGSRRPAGSQYPAQGIDRSRSCDGPMTQACTC